jgi:hypothetical protein
MVESQQPDQFAALAQDFIDLIDAGELSPAELLDRVQKILPILYRSALDLPDVDPTDEEENDRLSHEQWNQLFQGIKKKIGEWAHYQEMFDPYDFSELSPVVGDLADIYRDLLQGMHLWGHGRYPDAIWCWKFNFQTHWGDHALGALRAIHTIIFSYDIESLGSQNSESNKGGGGCRKRRGPHTP